MNFTPGYVHQVNNKTVLCQERQALKCAARERRRMYWLHANQTLQGAVEGGYLGMDKREIVEYGPNMEGIFKEARDQGVASQPLGEESPQHDSLNNLILSH